jgi:hypothetical protein
MVGEDGDESGTRSSNAGPDRADRALADGGGFVIAVPHQLGEDERMALVCWKFIEKEFKFDCASMIIGGTMGQFGSTGPLTGVDSVSTCAAGDGYHPPTGVTVSSERVKASKGTKVCVLHKIIDVIMVTEVAAELDHIEHRQLYEVLKRSRVAILGAEEELGWVSHVGEDRFGGERSWNFTRMYGD